MIKGFIHSIETMGTLDGPGIRMVVFFQGCSLRCVYCHNPDTWFFNKNLEITAEEIVKKAKRYKSYFKFNNGGITFSGGEPLQQSEFLLACLKLCKKQGIHTVIDTAGVGRGDYDEVLKYTDLVILDIKHSSPDKYKNITGANIDKYIEFKEAIIKNNASLWLKHVVTPGMNDTYEDMKEFENEVSSYPEDLINKVELLPYHTLGVFKYEELNIENRLKDISALSMERLKELKEYLSIKKLVR